MPGIEGGWEGDAHRIMYSDQFSSGAEMILALDRFIHGESPERCPATNPLVRQRVKQTTSLLERYWKESGLGD